MPPTEDTNQLVKAKFHYTDTDTDTDTDKVRARCRVRAKFHYTDADTGPDTDTDTDFFAAKRTRTDLTEFRRKKVRVRVGPVSVSV